MGIMKSLSTESKSKKSAKKAKKLTAGHSHKCTAHKDDKGKFGVWTCTNMKCDRSPTKICPDCEAKNPFKMPNVPDPHSNNLGEILGLKPDLPAASNAAQPVEVADTSAKPTKTRTPRRAKSAEMTEPTQADPTQPPPTPSPDLPRRILTPAYITPDGMAITLATMPDPKSGKFYPHLNLWQGQKWMYAVRVGELHDTREAARAFASEVREQHRAAGSIPARPEAKARAPRQTKSRWDQMSDEEIRQLIQQAQDELARRQTTTPVEPSTENDAA